MENGVKLWRILIEFEEKMSINIQSVLWLVMT
jgi:hypothetical protein